MPARSSASGSSARASEPCGAPPGADPRKEPGLGDAAPAAQPAGRCPVRSLRPPVPLVALALAGVLAAAPANANPDLLLPYLVQAACLDAADRVRPGAVPTDPDCTRRRPLATGEPLPYRKHEWPAVQIEATGPRGRAASDSLLGQLLGRPAILQSFDFGDDPQRAFGRFDAGRGDGGRALLLGPDGSAAAAMTEDGGAGVQWFPSPQCAGSGGAPTAGWLFAAPPVLPEWRSAIARLSRRFRQGECPTQFPETLTRWRLARIDLPVRQAGSPGIRSVPVDILVSEHYGRAAASRKAGKPIEHVTAQPS